MSTKDFRSYLTIFLSYNDVLQGLIAQTRCIYVLMDILKNYLEDKPHLLYLESIESVDAFKESNEPNMLTKDF